VIAICFGFSQGRSVHGSRRGAGGQSRHDGAKLSNSFPTAQGGRRLGATTPCLLDLLPKTDVMSVSYTDAVIPESP
jgi:hypothetical protein